MNSHSFCCDACLGYSFSQKFLTDKSVGISKVFNLYCSLRRHTTPFRCPYLEFLTYLYKRLLDRYSLALVARVPVGKARACSHSTLSFPLGVSQLRFVIYLRTSCTSALTLMFNMKNFKSDKLIHSFSFLSNYT